MRQSRKAVGMVVIWHQTLLIHTFQAVEEFGGRVSEIAKRRMKNLGHRQQNTGYFDNWLLTMDIVRDKNLNQTKSSVYPRASVEEWYNDFAFLLALYFIMRTSTTNGSSNDGAMNQCLFPNFNRAAETEEHKGPQHSGVASKWSGVFADLLKEYTQHTDFFVDQLGIALNEELKSHSQKKRCAQELADNGVSGM